MVSLLLAILAVACSSPTPTAEPELPSLPTPEVPPISEIDDAIERWKNSNLTDYFAESEERDQDELWKIRILVTDGLIRSAQRVELDGDGQWGEPFSIPRDEAREYTVESVFQRIRDDALGKGSAPLNMKVIFDQTLGYPILVSAEPLPSYNDEGHLVLNRQHSYDLTMEVKALLENTYGANQQPIYSLIRGGGPEAWCDNLRILSDSTSIYADDCRNDFLRLEVPESLLARLDDLRSSFTSLEDLRSDGEQFERLIIVGTGEGIPDDLTLENAWDLSDELHEFLSQRIGLGIVLSYIYDGELVGFEVYNKISLPSQLPTSGDLLGARHTLDGILLAISDDLGFSVLNIQTQQKTHFLSPLESGYYMPRTLSITSRLLISSVTENDSDPIQHGWVSLKDQTFNELPIPEDASGYGCDTGAAWSPDASKVAITGLGYGEPCNISPGLTVAELSLGTAQTSVSPMIDTGEGDESTVIAGAYTPTWSPDGTWIAFGLDQDATDEFTFPTRLYRVHPDGTNLTPLTSNIQGKATHPVWAQDDSLYYGLSGEGADQDGLYHYLPAENTHVLLISGSGIHPLSISPDGEFLLYEQDQVLKIWQFRLGETIAEIEGEEDIHPIFVGWLLTENER
jgi:WD40 repeat protein